MEFLNQFFTALNDIVWGVPMIVLILGTGLYLQLRLGFMPILRIPAFRVKLSQILFSTIRCTHAHAGCLERM